MNTDNKLAQAARKAIPYLRDDGGKYEDDGSNEPLELAREIESLLAAQDAREGERDEPNKLPTMAGHGGDCCGCWNINTDDLIAMCNECGATRNIGAWLAAQPQPSVGDGVSLIAAECKRQVEVEGWKPEHDDSHTSGELAIAAACYASVGNSRLAILAHWPWGLRWWKPTAENRIRELEKAGALIAAEIDRLRRLAAALENRDG